MQFIRHHSANDHLADTELLALYKSTGNLELLATLYGRYMALVYGVCVKYLQEEDRAKDAVMEIFESLVQQLARHEVQNFKSWLHVVAKNHCLMALRKEAHHKMEPIDESFMQSAVAEHHTTEEQEQVFLIMEKCLEALNTEQRKSVQLFYLEEKCYQEVAAITGYELAKVRSYIQNGRRNLKICMEKNSVE